MKIEGFANRSTETEIPALKECFHFLSVRRFSIEFNVNNKNNMKHSKTSNSFGSKYRSNDKISKMW